jgi:hypothetical protein
MNGPYHDLMALIRFGNYANVVTRSTDYQNILEYRPRRRR